MIIIIQRRQQPQQIDILGNLIYCTVFWGITLFLAISCPCCFYNIVHSLIIFCSAGNRRQRNHDKHEHDSEGRGGSGGAGGSDVIKPVKKKAKTSRK